MLRSTCSAMSSSTVHNVISTPVSPSCTDEQFDLKTESPQDSLQPVDDLPFPGSIGTKNFRSLPSLVPSAATTTLTSQYLSSPGPGKHRRSPAIARGPTSTESLLPGSSPASHNQLGFGHPEPILPSASSFSNQSETVQDVFALTENPPASPLSPPIRPTTSSRQYVARKPLAGVSEEMGNKSSKIKATSKKQVAKHEALKDDQTLDVSANVSSRFPVPRSISTKDEGLREENQFARPPEDERISPGSNATSTPSVKSYTTQTLGFPNQHSDMGDMLVEVLNSPTSNQRKVNTPDLTLTPSDTRSAASSSTISPGTVTGRKPIVSNHTPQQSFASLLQSRPKSGHIIMDIPAPKLTVIHLQCYQFHKNIRESSNVHAPVPCTTCHVEDKEIRWRCTWCCLRICGRCMEKLSSVPDRDLKRMLAVKEKERSKSQLGLKAAEKGHHIGRSI